MNQTWYDIFLATPGRMSPWEGAFIHALALAAARTTSSGMMAELGTYMGRSACAIGAAAKLVGMQLTCVDNWSQTDKTLDGSRETWTKHIKDAGLLDVVTLIEGDTVAVGKEYKEALSFLLIDAAHDEASVRADLQAWWPHIQHNGVLAFHDAGCLGVKPVVDELEKSYPVTFIGAVGALRAYQKR